jgi:hypothetical protein
MAGLLEKQDDYQAAQCPVPCVRPSLDFIVLMDAPPLNGVSGHDEQK